MTVAIDGTFFMNGNALETDGHLVHCEHGRRCISRSDGDSRPTPIVTHFEGKRLNSPNDVTVAGDGAIWFADPTFGLLMPSQGSLVEPELNHRSVYRYDRQTGNLRRMADFEQPNGLAFSQDGRTLYVSDTSVSLGDIPDYPIWGDQTARLHQIEAFDVDEERTKKLFRLGGFVVQTHALRNQKFFASFFKKKDLSCFLLPWPTPPRHAKRPARGFR